MHNNFQKKYNRASILQFEGLNHRWSRTNQDRVVLYQKSAEISLLADHYFDKQTENFISSLD